MAKAKNPKTKKITYMKVSLDMPKTLNARLVKAANQRGLSKSFLIREFIEAGIKCYEQ